MAADPLTVPARDVALALASANRVLFVPGYGLAVARAHHHAQQLAHRLGMRGVDVRYVIHPVAGRMPGHMDVLLAESGVPYDRLLDLQMANDRAALTDVVLALGANDVVNPSARDDPDSPLYGMPIVDVDRAGLVVVVKRSLAPGYAGSSNPLFHAGNTTMLLGDARDVLQRITDALAAV